MRKNFTFVVTLLIFFAACAAITAITVRDEPEYTEIFATEPPRETVADKININTATEEELRTLSGIGGVIAARIIAYREENGAFSDIAELMNVAGIGEKIFDGIKDFICAE